MSRIISIRRMASADYSPAAVPDQESDLPMASLKKNPSTKRLTTACLDAHQKSLTLISCSISNENSTSPADPEFMALLLAGTQICHSLAALLRVRSPQSSLLASTCLEISQACASACSRLQASSAAQSCAEAYRECEEACMAYLKHSEG